MLAACPGVVCLESSARFGKYLEPLPLVMYKEKHVDCVWKPDFAFSVIRQRCEIFAEPLTVVDFGLLFCVVFALFADDDPAWLREKADAKLPNRDFSIPRCAWCRSYARIPDSSGEKQEIERTPDP